MTQDSFLKELREALSGLPEEDIRESLAYYREIIEDKTEAGMSEAEAVSSLGSPISVAHTIMMEMPLPKILKSKYKKKTGWRAWELLLLILGSPIWLSLLIAAFAVAISLYAVLWTIAIALWATDASLLGVGGGCLLVFAVSLFTAPPTALLYLGVALFSFGLALLLFLLARYMTVYFAKLSKASLKAIKAILIGGNA